MGSTRPTRRRAPRKASRSGTPTSEGEATTTERRRYAHASHPRSPDRSRADRHGQGIGRPAATTRHRRARLRGAHCDDDRPRGHRSVFYQRVPRLFDALALARGDGRHGRLLKSLARVELLILDDWGLTMLTHEQGRDLLEIVDDRYNRGSTIVTSQLPVDHWHEAIANPTVADAILDRLVHNAHRLTLNGDSMRKAAAKRSGLDASPA